MTPDQYCQQKTLSSRSSFYFSFIFLDPPQRQAMTALYAFCREVDDVVDECHDMGVAHTKLAWWREEIQRLFLGTPQHPVSRALQASLARYHLPQEYFFEIIDGMEMDLEQHSYATFTDLMLYCYRVASVVGLLSAEIFGYQDRHTLKYAHDLGIAFQLTNILRDIREDGARDRVYIPEEDLDKFGLSRADVIACRASEAMRALLDFQAQRARHYYQKAFNQLPDVDRYAQRSGLIMAAVYQALLSKMESNSLAVLEQRLSLSSGRKLWIAWQCARQEKRRHLKRTATVS